jgi:hypothetical protein
MSHPARGPASAGIDGKAIAAGRRHGTAGITQKETEAAA